MCNASCIEPPPKYLSRRKTFNDNILACVGLKGSVVRSLDSRGSFLLYPSDKSDFVIANSLSKIMEEDTESPEGGVDDMEDMTLPLQDDNLHELIHTALKLQMDLQDTPGHSAGWRGIDQEHVEKIIPESLYLFLSVLLGGASALDRDEMESGLDESKKMKICSIAQDLVYAVSNNRKLTPKHIGLGLTLHQATRSEALVEVFHAAGMLIGMDTVRRIDTSIASQILKHFERLGGIYIPDDIVPCSFGRIILASCDNIDVLEETIDRKDTFHATQMMLWQRGPAPMRTSDGKQTIGRENALRLDWFVGV